MKILVCIFLFICKFAYAAQNGVVVTDGAMVYKNADFDSQVIGYLRVGQKVRISSKIFGGAFYRVQFKQGVLGYIADIDVQPDNRNSKVSNSKRSSERNQSFLGKKYLGLAFGSINFSEVFDKSNVSSQLMVYGVKWTSPLKFLSGPFVFDSTALLHFGYPKYYDSSVSKGESGRIALIDAVVNYSLYENPSRSFGLYIGAGPLFSYTSFIVELLGSKKDLTEFQFGGVLNAGAAYKFSRISLKIEPKYYFLKSSYFGFIGSLQIEF